MQNTSQRAARIVSRCRELARLTDVPGETTRLFLSPATRDAHTLLTWWMREAGLESSTDDIGNVRAVRRAAEDNAPTLLLFSHIDTVPNAGAFDGPLGVLLALEAMEELRHTPLPFHLELIAFSEEEGVRFAFPFLSSLALTGQLAEEHLARTDADGVSVAEALRHFGLDPARAAETARCSPNTFAALEVHIEQGPVLEAEDASLAVVEAIVGQSRFKLFFEGTANHAGTTPMALRHDALVAASNFIVETERYAANYTQLVATVGRIEALPGAMNVVPGAVHCTLDVRHPRDESRHAAVAHLLTKAQSAADHYGVKVTATLLSEQRAVPMDQALTQKLHNAAERTGVNALQLFSGAGHDSMIVAPHIPTTMLFVRSPGGISHNPAEDVREQDVAAALDTVINFLMHLHPHHP
ncbi:MAG: allantoate amidohydrolase [Acidobacteriaceae bacterium]|nr:allantoate amidohydrolase [Acidobacteriaceae bacterium]